MLLEISQKAQERLKEVLSNNMHLLVSVTSGGCNGFSYKYDICTEAPNDAVHVSEAPSIYVSNSAKDMLSGGVLQYEANDLGASFFSIINPNATSKCGCGNSFSTF